MKIKVLNYIFCGIITLNLASCGNKNESYSNREISSEPKYESDKKTETKSEFIYSNADKKVEVTERVENGEDFTHKFLVPVKSKTN